MPAKPKTASLDLDAISTDVAERFDAVRWDAFNSRDTGIRNETRLEVLQIRDDLMKVATVDQARAARVWDAHVPSFVPRPAELPEAMRAAEPLVLNSIEPGRKRRRVGAEPFLDPSQPVGGPAELEKSPTAPAPTGGAPEPGSGSTDPKVEDPNAERVRMLLDGLNRQYLKSDDRYHFRDRAGEVAFEAQEKKLLTQHETPAVVASMIDLAEAKGWSSVKVDGTKEFRREAWLQASLRDIEVTGYQPTKLDKAKLDDIRSERVAGSPANTISVDAPGFGSGGSAARFEPLAEDGKAERGVPLTAGQDQFLRAMEATMRHRGDSAEAIAKARDLAHERLTSERVHVGTLVEVGTAPYQDRQGEKRTPFVVLKDGEGQSSKVWGVDLPRALEASGAEPGQKIAVAFRGRQPVEVDVAIRDGKGEVVRTDRKTVDRNTWEVVKFDRLRAESKASVATALDRQNNPASLKVFDPTARPAQPAQEQKRSRAREVPRERTL